MASWIAWAKAHWEFLTLLVLVLSTRAQLWKVRWQLYTIQAGQEVPERMGPVEVQHQCSDPTCIFTGPHAHTDRH